MTSILTRQRMETTALAQPGVEPVGVVLDLAFKSAAGGPMRRAAMLTAVPGHGIAEGPASSPRREVTLLSAGQWRQVMSELRADLPWHARRANVLVDAATLAHLIGKTIRIGEVVVDILGETRPCNVMDEQCPGLRMALGGERRGGVHGQVRKGGAIRVGDTVAIIDAVRRPE